MKRLLLGSYRTLLTHRARSSLAAAAVAFGVALVFVFGAIGSGARAELLRGVERSGTHLLLVRPANAPIVAARRKIAGAVTTLRLEDCTAIEQLDSVSAAAPVVDGQLKVRSSAGATLTKVVGTTPILLELKDYAIAQGRIWSEDEESGAARVAVLGALVAERLFPDGDAVGETVRIRGVPFAVIGVLRVKGSAADGSDNDNQVLVPTHTALRRIYDRRSLSFVYVLVRPASSQRQPMAADLDPSDGQSVSASARGERANAVQGPLAWLVRVTRRFGLGPNSQDPQDDLAVAEDQVRRLLRQSHRLEQRRLIDDFSIQNRQGTLKLRETLASSLGSTTTAMALIAVLIGGTGVAGMMLLSVQERTSEIALRIAVGARTIDIGLQFFTESMMIALTGGALGVLTGAMGAWVAGRWTGWQIHFAPETLLASLGVACLIGLVAGVLPARRASRIPPIQAFAKE